jgi:hypothetical protein
VQTHPIAGSASTPKGYALLVPQRVVPRGGTRKMTRAARFPEQDPAPRPTPVGRQYQNDLGATQFTDSFKEPG